MGVQPLRKMKKVASSGKPAIKWSIRRVFSVSFRFGKLPWTRLARRQLSEGAAASVAQPRTGQPRTKNKHELRPEIIAIGRSFIDRYDQALKQLAE